MPLRCNRYGFSSVSRFSATSAGRLFRHRFGNGYGCRTFGGSLFGRLFGLHLFGLCGVFGQFHTEIQCLHECFGGIVDVLLRSRAERSKSFLVGINPIRAHTLASRSKTLTVTPAEVRMMSRCGVPARSFERIPSFDSRSSDSLVFTSQNVVTTLRSTRNIRPAFSRSLRNRHRKSA